MLDLGIREVVGVALGSTLVAQLRGEYRPEFPEGVKDLVDGILGSAMMGVGGVFAYGCTTGNGLSRDFRAFDRVGIGLGSYNVRRTLVREA